MELKQQLEQVPHEPGCYFFKDSESKSAKILYIGKAKDLKKRLTSYFLSNRDEKTQAMLSHARHIDWIIAPNEVEALVLEARLIREHQPQFNIDLKDNKRYAFIKITDEPYPRLITIRQSDGKQKDIVGPFTDGTQRMELLSLSRKLFRLRVCKTMPKRVCLYYHIGQCSGPCEQKISKEDYLKDVQRARMFLHGQSPELITRLEKEMKEASKDQRYEDAKRLRDTIGAVHHASNRQVMAREKRYDEDVLLARKLEDAYFFLVLHVKKGMVTNTEEFRIPLNQVDPEAPLDDFLKSYYQDRGIPEELLLEHELADPAIEAYLATAKTGRFSIGVPHHGPKRALVDLAKKNLHSRIDQTSHLLAVMQDQLRLPALPRRIDAFDNSHIQGTDVVSACVRFTDAKPDKAHYRKLIIKTVTGNDDFAAMREAVSRRYQSAQKHREQLPNLILIDGGKGQLHAAYDALQELSLNIPVIGLAKREEEVFVPGLPVPLALDKKSEASLFLQRVRNEIHRFVITFHRSRRSKRQVKSALDDIPGIGEKTKFALLQRFGSVAGVKKASDEELMTVVSQKQLVALRNI